MNKRWFEINFYLFEKWMTTYIDMLYYGELLAPKEFMFIMNELYGNKVELTPFDLIPAIHNPELLKTIAENEGVK